MSEALSQRQASDAVTHLGWRYLLGMLRAGVPVSSMSQAADVAARAVAAAGADAGTHLSVDLRPDRTLLTLQTAAIAAVTTRDVELAGSFPPPSPSSACERCPTVLVRCRH